MSLAVAVSVTLCGTMTTAAFDGDVRVTDGGVFVFTADGTLLGRILTGVPTANVAWGEDGSTLFVTANHRVLRLRTKTQGVPLPSAR